MFQLTEEQIGDFDKIIILRKMADASLQSALEWHSQTVGECLLNEKVHWQEICKFHNLDPAKKWTYRDGSVFEDEG